MRFLIILIVFILNTNISNAYNGKQERFFLVGLSAKPAAVSFPSRYDHEIQHIAISKKTYLEKECIDKIKEEINNAKFYGDGAISVLEYNRHYGSDFRVCLRLEDTVNFAKIKQTNQPFFSDYYNFLENILYNGDYYEEKVSKEYKQQIKEINSYSKKIESKWNSFYIEKKLKEKFPKNTPVVKDMFNYKNDKEFKKEFLNENNYFFTKAVDDYDNGPPFTKILVLTKKYPNIVKEIREIYNKDFAIIE